MSRRVRAIVLIPVNNIVLTLDKTTRTVVIDFTRKIKRLFFQRNEASNLKIFLLLVIQKILSRKRF